MHELTTPPTPFDPTKELQDYIRQFGTAEQLKGNPLRRTVIETLPREVRRRMQAAKDDSSRADVWTPHS